MFSDLQKQKLVYDLFLEKIREDLYMKKLTSVDIDETRLKDLQAKYDICVKIVESLNL